MPEFTAQQSTQALTVSQALYSTLAPLLPTSQIRPDGWKPLHEQVTMPAVRLATSMRRSIVDYRIWSRASVKRGDNGNGGNLPVYITAVQRASMVDLASNKVIRPDSVLKVAEDGRIGEEMLIVQPSLLRVQTESGGEGGREGERGGGGGGGGGGKATSVTLCKPTVLVKLDEPMGKRSRGIKALGDWTGSWFGGSPEQARD